MKSIQITKAPSGGDTPSEAKHIISHSNYNTKLGPLSTGAREFCKLRVMSFKEVLEQVYPDNRGRLKKALPHPSNSSLVVLQERIWEYSPSSAELNQRAIRLKAPEECRVEDCDCPAAFMSYLLKEYRTGNDLIYEAVSTGVDQDCPFLCAEHRFEDMESERLVGEHKYSNSCGWATRVYYREVLPPRQMASQQKNGEVAKW